ncbi:unnamed protein product [Amoebophrya sp. A120]|nr:unnamed protein product [Amoebophrya sp. A120]|eukprot:GSA120T00019077001.1
MDTPFRMFETGAGGRNPPELPDSTFTGDVEMATAQETGAGESTSAQKPAEEPSCREEARRLLSHWLQCEEEAASISRKVGAKTEWPTGAVRLPSRETSKTHTTNKNKRSWLASGSATASSGGGRGPVHDLTGGGTEDVVVDTIDLMNSEDVVYAPTSRQVPNLDCTSTSSSFPPRRIPDLVGREQCATSSSTSTSDAAQRPPRGPVRMPSQTTSGFAPTRTGGARPPPLLTDKVLHTVLRNESKSLDPSFEEDLAVAMGAISRVQEERRAQREQPSCPTTTGKKHGRGNDHHGSTTSRPGSKACSQALPTAVDKMEDEERQLDPRAVMEERHRLIAEKREQRRQEAVAASRASLAATGSSFGQDEHRDVEGHPVVGQGSRGSRTSSSSSSLPLWRTTRRPPTPSTSSCTGSTKAGGPSTRASFPAGPNAFAKIGAASSPTMTSTSCAADASPRSSVGNKPGDKLCASPTTGSVADYVEPGTSCCSTIDDSRLSSIFQPEGSSVASLQDSVAHQETELRNARAELKKETNAYKSLLCAREKETRLAVQKAEVEEETARVRERKRLEENKQAAKEQQEKQKRKDLGCKRIVSSVQFALQLISKRNREGAWQTWRQRHTEVTHKLRRLQRKVGLQLQRALWASWNQYVKLVLAERAEEQWFRALAREKANEARAREFAATKKWRRAFQAWTLFTREAGHLRALETLKQKTKRFLELRAGSGGAVSASANHDGTSRVTIDRDADEEDLDSLISCGDAGGTGSGKNINNPYAVRYPSRSRAGATSSSSTSRVRGFPPRTTTSPSEFASSSTGNRDAGVSSTVVMQEMGTTPGTNRTRAENRHDTRRPRSTDENDEPAEQDEAEQSHSQSGPGTTKSQLAPPKKSKLVLQMEQRAAERKARHAELDERRREAEARKRELSQERERLAAEREVEEKRQRVRDAKERKKKEEAQKQQVQEMQEKRRQQAVEARQYRDYRLKRKVLDALHRSRQQAVETLEIAARYHTETMLAAVLELWHQTSKTQRTSRLAAEHALHQKAMRFQRKKRCKLGLQGFAEFYRQSKAEGEKLYHAQLLRVFLQRLRLFARHSFHVRCGRAQEQYRRALLRRLLPLWCQGVEESKVDKHKERLLLKVKGWLTEMHDTERPNACG